MARCKSYQRADYRNEEDPGDRRFVVYLYHSRKKWTRTWCDDSTPIDSKARADRICSIINDDLEKTGKGFNPKKHFGYSLAEFNFNTYASKWLVGAAKENRYARSGWKDVNRCVQRAIDHFGAADMRGIKQAHVKDYLSSLPNHLSPASRRVYRDFLRTVLSDAAVDYEGVVFVPHFPSIEVPEKDVPWIDREWQEKIIAEIEERDRPIFRFLCAWPVRPGEARALRWECVNPAKGIIVIKRKFSGTGRIHLEEFTKTQRPRYVPITDEIEGILESVKRGKLRSQYVFIDRRGLPYTGHISKVWTAARDASGCPEKVDLYHGTKHSFITQHNDQLLLASKAAGHTSIRMTRRYDGVNVDNLRKLAEKKVAET